MAMHIAPSVVVGFDGSSTSRAALMVAAGEAFRRGRTLVVVHVQESHVEVGGAVDDLLAEAVHLVRPMLSPARVAVRERAGAAATVLCEQAEGAELLVVGRGEPGLLAWFMGSVAIDVVTKAPCPVVVVGDREPLFPHGGPVVAGIDTEHADEVLLAAFREADLRKADLLVVHSWSAPRWLGPDGVMVLADSEAEVAQQRAWLADAVRPFQEKYPAVPVTEIAREGHAGTVLEQTTAGARLLVVGTRGRGPLTGLILGSVGQHLVRHALCPVMVVRSAVAPG